MAGFRARHLVVVVASVVVVCAVVCSILRGIWTARSPSVDAGDEDFLQHPVYSRYDFSARDNVVHFGTQPLWAFAGNVNEAMRRDRILEEELRELGLEIRFHAFLKGRDLNYFIRRGDLDGGIGGDMATLTLASRVPLLIVALTDQGYDEIVARNGISVRHLKGKRIGCPMGASTHHAILEALKFADIRPDQVKLVPMDATEMANALARRKIDACGIWEPMTSIVLERNPDAAVIHRSRYLGFTYFTKDFVDRHPKAVPLILAAQVRGIRWMLRDRANVLLSSRWASEAGNPLAPGTQPPYPADHLANVVVQASGINRTPIIPAFALTDGGMLQREFTFLKDLGLLPEQAEWQAVRAMFDRSILEEVLASPTGYRLDEFHYEDMQPP